MLQNGRKSEIKYFFRIRKFFDKIDTLHFGLLQNQKLKSSKISPKKPSFVIGRSIWITGRVHQVTQKFFKIKSCTVLDVELSFWFAFVRKKLAASAVPCYCANYQSSFCSSRNIELQTFWALSKYSKGAKYGVSIEGDVGYRSLESIGYCSELLILK